MRYNTTGLSVKKVLYNVIIKENYEYKNQPEKEWFGFFG